MRAPTGQNAPGATLRVVLQRLLDDPERMVADFTAEVRSIPAYSSRQLISDEEIASSAQQSLTMIIKAVMSAAETGVIDLGNLPQRLAASRADLRVASEDLVEAIRLDFSVLWRHLLGKADADESADLTADVDLIWRVIEQYAREVRDRYHEHVFATSPDLRASLQHHIGRLFAGGDSPDTATVSQVARALRLTVDQEFVVCVVPADGFEALRGIELLLETLNVRFFLWDRGTDVVFFWPARGMLQNPGERQRILRPIEALPYSCIEPVVGLGALPAAAAAGRRILENVRPPHTGPCTMLDIWPRVASTALRRLSTEFDSLALRAAELPDGERERVLQAVAVYLGTGSPTRTGEILHSHRNTVLNRLRRFSEVTGLNLSTPRDAGLAVLLLEHLGMPETGPVL